jgi:hypothetical protein
VKIVVSGDRAQLYLDDKERPAFLVNGLKLGVDERGGVGIEASRVTPDASMHWRSSERHPGIAVTRVGNRRRHG